MRTLTCEYETGPHRVKNLCVRANASLAGSWVLRSRFRQQKRHLLDDLPQSALSAFTIGNSYTWDVMLCPDVTGGINLGLYGRNDMNAVAIGSFQRGPKKPPILMATSTFTASSTRG